MTIATRFCCTLISSWTVNSWTIAAWTASLIVITCTFCSRLRSWAYWFFRLRLHAKADTATFFIDRNHTYRDDIAWFDAVHRVSNEVIGHLWDMNQTILMDTDINEATKGCDVGHHAFKLHTFAQVFNTINVFTEVSRFKLRTWVACRLGKLFNDGFNTDIVIVSSKRSGIDAV